MPRSWEQGRNAAGEQVAGQPEEIESGGRKRCSGTSVGEGNQNRFGKTHVGTGG